jgi:aryl-alcohol dehydrogenase-like predicted oxidoreductase
MSQQTPSKPKQEQVRLLLARIAALEERARRQHRAPEKLHPRLLAVRERPLLRGHATRDGTERFVGTRGKGSVGFYRPMQDVLASTLGIGASHGAQDQDTDRSYIDAISAALRGGINLIDTSLNYRHQRSELAVGAAIRARAVTRDGIIVCTKGGYLVPGAFARRAASGACGNHSMTPAFLADQIRRSRRNLGLETIDVYYLHNPEVQLRSVSRSQLMKRMFGAFEALERAVSDGLIRYYGTATWDGYRSGALSLSALADGARRIVGDGHHFRFVQLPFNLEMQEALTRRENGASVLTVAAERGLTVVASAVLGQGRLRANSRRAIQFARSTQGICAALVGMSQRQHVEENLALRTLPCTD